MFTVLFLGISSILWSCCSGYFMDISYNEIHMRLGKLNGPFAEIQTANELYKIPLAQERNVQCSADVVRLTHIASSTASESHATTARMIDNTRPQMYISGEIHGNERIGAAATLITAEILVKAAECVILSTSLDIKEQAISKDACLMLEKEYTIKDARTLQWLTMLVTRRDIFMTPTTNCMGYIHDSRVDAGVDPNRDYPYHRLDTRCLRATSSKVINSIMKNNLIQSVITFHGGMVAIAYEWGSLNHNTPKDKCPDDIIHEQHAIDMSLYGGAFGGTHRTLLDADYTIRQDTNSSDDASDMVVKTRYLRNRQLLKKDGYRYPYGRMNGLVYGVNGGMEDWAYASGFDRKSNILCDEYQHSPEFASNTTTIHTVAKDINSQADHNLAIVFLIETSDAKKPVLQVWGKSEQILNNSAFNEHNGHVPRNVRLSLVGIDLLQPYVCVESVSSTSAQSGTQLPLTVSSIDTVADVSRRIEKSKVQSDLMPRHLMRHTPGCVASPRVPVGMLTHHVDVSWSVGGCTTIDATWLAILVNPTMSRHQLQHLIGNNSYSALYAYLRKVAYPIGVPTIDTPIARRGDEESYVLPLSRTKHGSTSTRAKYTLERGPMEPIRFHSKIEIRSLFGDCDIKDGESVDGVVYLPPGIHWIVPWAVVDTDMKQPHQGYPSELPPQSHIVNARTNDDWNFNNIHTNIRGGLETHTIIGQKYWPSEPIVIHVPDGSGRSSNTDLNGSESESFEILSHTIACSWWDTNHRQLNEVEVNDMAGETGANTDVGTSEHSQQSVKDTQDASGILFISLSIIGFLIVVTIGYCCIYKIIRSPTFGGRRFYGSNNHREIVTIGNARPKKTAHRGVNTEMHSISNNMKYERLSNSEV